MTSLLWLALTTFVVVQSNVILRDRHVESWDNQDRQMSRGIRSVQKKEFDDWLTEEQKEELKPYVKDAKVFREKVMKFYKQLPYLTQQKWDETYARQCLEWIDDVEAKADLGTQFRLDTEAASKKWDELAQKLPEDHREKVNVWKNDCKVLLTTTTRERHRRDLDNNFADFTKWMTDDQKKELENLKNSGKSLTDIRAKSIEFFEALPADRQASLREEYKGKCKSYFNTIATDAEMTEIKALYDSGSKGEIASKVAAIVDRQPDDIKTVATKMQSVCTDVYAAARKFRRDINQKIDKHLSWLSDEQKQAVREMYAAGKSKEEIKSTVLSWLSNLEGSAKTDAKEELRKECYKWLETAASQAERDELHKLHETDHGACKTKVREYIKRLGVQTRAEVEKNLPFCEKVWYGDHDAHAHHAHHHRKRRHVYAIDKFIKWLTLEQLAEVEELEYLGADFNVVLAKVHEFFMEQSDEKKQEIKTQFKEECISWVKEVATPEELAQLKDYKEAKNFDQVSILLIKLESRLDERKKHTVEHVRDICLKLWEIPTNSKEWGISIRKRREHSHDDAFEKYLSWTSESQKVDLKQIKEGGDRQAFYKKVMELFGETTGETRTKAIEELKSACKHFAHDIFGDEKLAIITKMKESGSTHEEIGSKLTEFANALDDDVKQKQAIGLVEGCKRVYTAAATRRRREQHSLSDAFGKYLTWTTNEQKEALKALEADGNKAEIYKKVLEYFDATSGDTRKTAAEELKGACKHYGIDLFGEEKVASLKQLKESGASNEELKKKILTLVDEITDKVKKGKASKLVEGCEKVYAAASRKRRDHHEHKLDDAFTSYLSWTTEEQRAALKALEENKEELYKKMMDFYETTTGETRTEATEKLKSACKHFSIDLFGADKVATITQLKESGATPDELKAKVMELIGELTDEKKKEKANMLVKGCQKIYGVASRKRRDHEHTLEDALGKYLTWITDEQKIELKNLKDEGKKDEIYGKIMTYFEATAGETRKKAVEELKGACKHYAEDMFGEEKVGTLKTLKESGASVEDIHKKVLEFVGEVTDEVKKAKATKLAEGCGKVFSVAATSRKRRDHHHTTLEEALPKYLTWLTEDQKNELKALKEAGEKEGIYTKILEFFDATSGDTKKTAIEELKGACKSYAKDFFGEEKFKTMTTLKESGASVEEIRKKVNELVDEITDESKKARATKLTAACGKVYTASLASRRRRAHHYHHSFEDSLTKFLGWLTEDQRDELKSLRQAELNMEIYVKIVDYFRETTGETRREALVELKAGCNHYAQDLFGEAHYSDMEEMKRSGATPREFKMKINEIISGMGEGERQDKSFRLATVCAAVYTSEKRRQRRDHHHTSLEEALPKYLTWLTEDQKNELKTLKEAGKKEEVYTKILEFFDATSGDTKKTAIEELKGACKSYAKDLFGEAKFETIKTLKDSGASVEDMKKKVLELVSEITDEDKKAKATKLAEGCGKIYAAAAASRKRRDHHHTTLEDALTKYLTWLSEDQKNELKSLKEAGKTEEIYTKILEFFDATTGDTKSTAIEELKGACKSYAKDLFGDEKFETMKTLKESGASIEEIQKKVKELVDEITDEAKKTKAAKLTKGCGKIYAAATSRKRRDHHHTSLEEALSKYLTWLTEDQKNELKSLKEAGKTDEIYPKILEFFDATTGDTKNTAIEELKGACKSYAKDFFGDEKFETMKVLKETGASVEDMKKKVQELVGEITDEAKKAKATKLVEGCGKIYAAAAPSRMRRMREEYDLF